MPKKQKHDPIKENHFRVAVFGSARIKTDDPAYQKIRKLAQHIAKAGYDIVTGGGPGLMEAANLGHKEGRDSKNNKHVHSYGLNINLPEMEMTNKHLDIKKEYNRFSSRLDSFMSLSHAVVVAPGGIGTMLELLYTWQLIQVQHICAIPVILFGDMWPDLIKWVEKYPLEKKYLDKSDLTPLFLARNNREVMKILNQTYEEFLKDGTGFCLNIHKYRLVGDPKKYLKP